MAALYVILHTSVCETGQLQHMAAAGAGPCLPCLESWFCQRPHSSSCTEEQLIHTLHIFTEEWLFGKLQKGKTAVGFIILFLSNWKLAGEAASCSFTQFKEEVDYFLICFKVHKTVFLIQECNTGYKDESCACRLTDHQ